MNKIPLIIKREYITRVRKKSFIIMTFLGPLLFGAFLILPAWLSQLEDNEKKIIAVVETNEFNETIPDSVRMFNVLPDNENIDFQYVNAPLDVLKKTLSNTGYYGILHIPYNIINIEVAEFYTKKQPSMGIEDYITRNIEDYIYKLKLRKNDISVDVLNSAQTSINLKITKLGDDGKYEEQAGNDLKRWVGYICGFLIYFFIFFFGAQVMRGIIEEKTSRIIEVIISSVKPFQLMMGKIAGIGLIGLTQFLAWIILTAVVVFGAQQFLGINKNAAQEQVIVQNYFESQAATQATNQVSEVASPNPEFENFFSQLSQIKFVTVILAFIFYFVSGFMLYGSLFAAIGAAVDSETDTQQFMLPVTIPLIFSIIIMVSAFSNPEGQLAVIFSIIPFTSPIVMMARIGFDIPVSQIILSMVLLIVTFIFTTWFAGKIYRTGILMYGKKPTYKELWKWIRYKN